MKLLVKLLKAFAFLSVPMTILVLIGKYYQPEYQMVLKGQGDMLGINVVLGVVINLIFNIFMILGAGLLFYSLAYLIEKKAKEGME